MEASIWDEPTHFVILNENTTQTFTDVMSAPYTVLSDLSETVSFALFEFQLSIGKKCDA